MVNRQRNRPKLVECGSVTDLAPSQQSRNESRAALCFQALAALPLGIGWSTMNLVFSEALIRSG
jgi:hypothetical protein